MSDQPVGARTWQYCGHAKHDSVLHQQTTTTVDRFTGRLLLGAGQWKCCGGWLVSEVEAVGKHVLCRTCGVRMQRLAGGLQEQVWVGTTTLAQLVDVTQLGGSGQELVCSFAGTTEEVCRQQAVRQRLLPFSKSRILRSSGSSTQFYFREQTCPMASCGLMESRSPFEPESGPRSRECAFIIHGM